MPTAHWATDTHDIYCSHSVGNYAKFNIVLNMMLDIRVCGARIMYKHRYVPTARFFMVEYRYFTIVDVYYTYTLDLTYTPNYRYQFGPYIQIQVHACVDGC